MCVGEPRGCVNVTIQIKSPSLMSADNERGATHRPPVRPSALLSRQPAHTSVGHLVGIKPQVLSLSFPDRESFGAPSNKWRNSVSQ